MALRFLRNPNRPQPAETPAGARPARAIDHQRKNQRGLHAGGRADGDSRASRSGLIMCGGARAQLVVVLFPGRGGALIAPMPELTRRRSTDAPDECWHVW